MQLTEDKIIEIFYLADEFCQEFDKTVSKRALGNEPKKKAQNDAKRGDHHYGIVPLRVF